MQINTWMLTDGDKRQNNGACNALQNSNIIQNLTRNMNHFIHLVSTEVQKSFSKKQAFMKIKLGKVSCNMTFIDDTGRKKGRHIWEVNPAVST